MTDLLTLLSHTSRRNIVLSVWRQEQSAGDIARSLPLTFGAVSQHLRRLQDAGVLSVRRAGRHRFYRANRDAVGPLAAYFEALWADQLMALKTAAEAAHPTPPQTRKRRT